VHERVSEFRSQLKRNLNSFHCTPDRLYSKAKFTPGAMHVQAAYPTWQSLCGAPSSTSCMVPSALEKPAHSGKTRCRSCTMYVQCKKTHVQGWPKSYMGFPYLYICVYDRIYAVFPYIPYMRENGFTHSS
jgi:hypothetical protein